MQQLTMTIAEHPAFINGGTQRTPAPLGDSPVWQTPPWQFEHLIADLSHLRAASIAPHCRSYGPLGDITPGFQAVDVCIDDTGWTTMAVDPSVLLQQPAPPPRYLWDILLEVAQTRMHDGGLAEGQADLELSLSDVPIGIATADIVDRIRLNMSADPLALLGMAERLTNSTSGDADFYYYVEAETDHDYLFFIVPSDIRKDDQGLAVRAYAYAHPGFFSDALLQTKVSSTSAVDGDEVHEKVRIVAGMTLYVQNVGGQRYRIDVGDKPARHSVALTVTALEALEP
jgi:hypothetical protein